MSPVSRTIVLASWIAATLLVYCLYMIARFFQQKSGQRSYYQLFVLPLVLYLAGALYYTKLGNDFVITPVADALFFGAAVSSLALTSYLFSLMTGGKR